MSGYYAVIEARLFCLLLIVFLYIFKLKTQSQTAGDKLLYALSFAVILLSAMGNAVQIHMVKSTCFAVCGLGVFAAMYVAGKYIPVNKVVTTLLCAVFGVVSFYLMEHESSIPCFVLVFVLTIRLILEQQNKIQRDKLTKLYNRYGMDRELKQQLKQYRREHSDSFYVIACDLDNFKHINDTWGHAEGDRALVLVAEALSKAAKKYDADVFRIGGDEFVIITDKSYEGLGDVVAKAVQSELDSIVFRNDFDIRMSIGVELYDGVRTIDRLLKDADKKLYEVKYSKNK